MKHLLDKYGLFKTILAICLPILLYKLDAILTAVHLYF